MNASVKPRRKPVQSRAWMTSVAIQDSFVRLLLEQGYEKISIRDIAMVAGIGLGTLYHYYPGKESVAAVTIRTWLRRLARSLSDAVAGPEPRTLEATARALINAHVRTVLSQSAEWRALISLERSISTPAKYRQVYRFFVDIFEEAFARASDWPAHLDVERTAFNVFAIVEAMVAKSLVVRTECPATDELVRDVEFAVLGYLERATRP
jgi:AcrR family transcriptional regulator